MKIQLVVIGKIRESYLEEGISIFTKRLKHYCNFEIIVIPDLKKKKNLSEEMIKSKESDLILSKLSNDDFVLLLDERGKSKSSVEFSAFIQQKMNHSTKKLVFVIGGAYGFSDGLYKRSNQLLNMSKMVFPHEMIRLFFVEQLYRAHTILRNEPYHHV